MRIDSGEVEFTSEQIDNCFNCIKTTIPSGFGFSSFLYGFNTAMCSPKVPLTKQIVKDLWGWSLVYLLKGLPDVQGLHGFQIKSAKLNLFKALSLVYGKVITVFQKQVASVFQNRIIRNLGLSDLIYGFVNDFGNMKSIKDNGCFRQVIFDPFNECGGTCRRTSG